MIDVIVVGAGPAGTSLAWRLASAGVRVLLVDARAFPRSKPCGDAVSPGATPLLREIGVWDELRSGPAAGVQIEGWRIRSPDGGWFEGRFSTGIEASPPAGLAIDRAALDASLLRRALGAGARLRERTRVIALVRRGERVIGVRVRGPDGRQRAWTARVVVGADGLRSRVARGLGPVRGGRRARLGIVARLAEPARTDRWGELRLSREGVLGHAPTSRESCNVTLVVPRDRARELAGDRDAFVRRRLAAYGLEDRLRTARWARPIEVTGPFEATPRRRTAPGALLVGDAAGYFDPFTGQGVYRALSGARLAADTIRRILDDPASEAEALSDYERALGRELRTSRGLQRLVDRVVSTPRLIDQSARLLRARPDLASRFVDATGDRLTPEQLLDPRGWLAALARPGPTVPPASEHPRAYP